MIDSMIGASPAVAFSGLLPHHAQQFRDRGFDDIEITQMISEGLRSVEPEELATMGYLNENGKPYMDCKAWAVTKSDGYVQVCPDDKERFNKYLNPTNYKAVISLPKGAEWITEGFVDAEFCCFRGNTPMGVCAGVSHYKAASEGSGLNWLFDADGWTNCQVFTNLVNAALHTGGKVQLLPKVTEQGKDGAQEFFKAGKTEQDFKNLLARAFAPKDLLFELPNHWKEIENHSKKIELASALARLAIDLLTRHEQESLWNIVSKALKLRLKQIRDIAESEFWKTEAGQQKKAEHEQRQAEKRESRQNPHKGQGLPYRLDKEGSPVLAPQSEVANYLSETYRERLAWNAETETFYRYEAEYPGLWSKEHDAFVDQAVVMAELNASPVCNEYSDGYAIGILNRLRRGLAVKHWDEAPGLIPLQNGVFEVATGKLLSHAPGYRLTWQLPYSYESSATCDPIVDWLRESQDGDVQRVQLLRAYLKAVVTGRSDLQRFIELIGPGGSGKSTYQRLAIALVGLQNTHTTTLKDLETSKFETASIYGKRLVLVNDSERYGGGVSTLKALTGQDTLKFEEKFKQSRSGFVPRAMVILVANEPIQSNDYTSGLERRRITVPFLNRVEAANQRDLLTIENLGVSGEFVPYLPGLFNWVMSLPDQQMTQLIKCTDLNVPSLQEWKLDTLISSNPIAEWLNERCSFEDGKTYVGIARKVRRSESENEMGMTKSKSWEEYENCDSWLYANYVNHSALVGSKPISIRRFSELVIDLCTNQLGRSGISKGKDSGGAFIRGLALRSPDCTKPNCITGFSTAPPELPETQAEEPQQVPNLPLATVEASPLPKPKAELQQTQQDDLASTIDVWLARFKLAKQKNDVALRAIYEEMSKAYPEPKHPIKQRLWDALDRDCKKRIERLLGVQK
jgi:P4 family phage/plasmid primase-like protien